MSDRTDEFLELWVLKAVFHDLRFYIFNREDGLGMYEENEIS